MPLWRMRWDKTELSLLPEFADLYRDGSPTRARLRLCGRAGVLSEFGKRLADCRGSFFGSPCVGT